MNLFKNILSHGFLSNQFIAGGLIMVVGSNVHNLGQLLFHFMAGKILSEAQYGELATIISILGFIAIIQTAYGLAIVKFISSQKDEKKIRVLSYWFNKWALYMAITISIFTLILAPFLSNFLHISDPKAIYLLAPAIFFYILVTTARSILQALLRFKAYVLSLSAEVWVKIPFALLLMMLGFKVFGAMVALIIGVIIAYVLARRFISKELETRDSESPPLRPILNYTLPAFIQGVSMTSMYTLDLLLVKHFFAPDQAGIYAALAILGRIVLFGTSPIVNVMFPLVVKRHSHGLPYHNIFYLSILAISGFSGLIVLFYFLFPQLPITFLYKSSYLSGAGLLWWFGLFTLLLSLSQLFVQFYLSVGKTRVVWLFAVAAVLEALLIWFYHGTLFEVIKQTLIASSLLLVALIVYFPYHDPPSPKGFGGASRK